MGSCSSKKYKINVKNSSSLEDEIVQELKVLEKVYERKRRYSEPINKIIVYPLYNTRPRRRRRKIRSLSEN